MTTLAQPTIQAGTHTESLEVLLPSGAVERVTRVAPGPIAGVSIYGDGDDKTGIHGHLVIVPQVGTYGMSTILSDVAARGGVGAVVGSSCMVDGVPAGLAVWRLGRGYGWLEIIDAVRALLRPHSTPEAISTAPGDLDSLADALAETLGGPVVIEDARFRVLSYSSFTGIVDRGRDAAILGRRMPPEWFHHLERLGALDALMTSEAIVDLPDGPLMARRRLIASVIADGQLIGILSVAEASEPLPADVADRMREAQRIAEPHLLRYRETQEVEGFERASALRRLLQGGRLSQAMLEELDLAPAAGYVILGLRYADQIATDVRSRSRLIDAASLHCQAYRWRAAVTAVGGTVYCVLALSARQNAEHVYALADRLARSAVTGSRPGVHVAISDTADDVTGLTALRAQADEIGEHLVRNGARESRVAGRREVGATLVLDRAAATIRADSAGLYDRLTALDALDAEHGTDDAATLAAYLATFGNANLAGRRLGVHRTTVLYRLRRITEEVGINLHDRDERLLCALLLRERDEATASGSDKR